MVVPVEEDERSLAANEWVNSRERACALPQDDEDCITQLGHLAHAEEPRPESREALKEVVTFRVGGCKEQFREGVVIKATNKQGRRWRSRARGPSR